MLTRLFADAHAAAGARVAIRPVDVDQAAANASPSIERGLWPDWQAICVYASVGATGIGAGGQMPANSSRSPWPLHAPPTWVSATPLNRYAGDTAMLRLRLVTGDAMRFDTCTAQGNDPL